MITLFKQDPTVVVLDEDEPQFVGTTELGKEFAEQ